MKVSREMQSLNYYSRRSRSEDQLPVIRGSLKEQLAAPRRARREKKKRGNARDSFSFANSGIIVRRSPNYLAQLAQPPTNPSAEFAANFRPNFRKEKKETSHESFFPRERKFPHGSWKFHRLIERAVREDK